jgi:hypothetical protein
MNRLPHHESKIGVTWDSEAAMTESSLVGPLKSAVNDLGIAR